jgi:hypothetical protein
MVIRKWLRLLYGRLSLLSLLLLVFISTVGCSKGPLSLLTGGGPNVAANVQVGKTNNQTVGTNTTLAPTVSLRPKSRVDTIDQSNETVNNYQLPLWVWFVGILLFVVGWVTDTPYTYVRRFKRR